MELSIDVVGVGTSKNSEELESWEVFGGERRTAPHFSSSDPGNLILPVNLLFLPVTVMTYRKSLRHCSQLTIVLRKAAGVKIA